WRFVVRLAPRLLQGQWSSRVAPRLRSAKIWSTPLLFGEENGYYLSPLWPETRLTLRVVCGLAPGPASGYTETAPKACEETMSSMLKFGLITAVVIGSLGWLAMDGISES